MDLLDEVAKTRKRVALAEEHYLREMRARNAAIRAARAERFGPGEIGQAAGLAPEQVRRICVAEDDGVGTATRPKRKI